MNVSYRCSKCELIVRSEIDDEHCQIACPQCEHSLRYSQSSVSDGEIGRCLVCPSKELFLRKNFPQRIGVAIVVIGFAISCVTWYFHLVLATFGVLFATAALDVVLFLIMGNVLQCYRCGALYRGVSETGEYQPFDLEIHEKHRQEKGQLQQTSAVDSSSV